MGMSANSDSYSKECALQAGMNLFLAKPFTIEELQTTLELFQPRRRRDQDNILIQHGREIPAAEEESKAMTEVL